MNERGLSEERRMMRESCRDFVDPFIRSEWQREWRMDPEDQFPHSILEAADRIGG